MFTILSLLFIPEANPHVLLQRRVKEMRKESGDDRWRAKSGVKEPPMRLLLLSLQRSMKVCHRHSVSHLPAPHLQPHWFISCTVSHLNLISNNSSLGIIFGYIYLLFTTYDRSSIFGLTLDFQRFLVAYMARRKGSSDFPT